MELHPREKEKEKERSEKKGKRRGEKNTNKTGVPGVRKSAEREETPDSVLRGIKR